MKKYIVENDQGAIFSCEADDEFEALEKGANHFMMLKLLMNNSYGRK